MRSIWIPETNDVWHKPSLASRPLQRGLGGRAQREQLRNRRHQGARLQSFSTDAQTIRVRLSRGGDLPSDTLALLGEVVDQHVFAEMVRAGEQRAAAIDLRHLVD